MAPMSVDIDRAKLRSLYASDPVARAILDHFASGERNWRTTTVDRIQQNVTSEGADVSRGDVIRVFKALEGVGCGTFKAGRKGWESRFEWIARMVSVGQAAAGETDLVEEVTDEDLNEENTELSLKHQFWLRLDFTVALELPQNLTAAEATRLSEFVRTLPFHQEVQAGVAPPAGQHAWGEGIRRSAGALADRWTEEDDRVLAEIQADRKRATGREIAE